MTASVADKKDRLSRFLRPGWAFGGLFLLALLLFLALLRVPRVRGQLVGSDGVYYYVYARSLVLDHDLDFLNEHAYFQIPPPNMA